MLDNRIEVLNPFVTVLMVEIAGKVLPAGKVLSGFLA